MPRAATRTSFNRSSSLKQDMTPSIGPWVSHPLLWTKLPLPANRAGGAGE